MKPPQPKVALVIWFVFFFGLLVGSLIWMTVLVRQMQRKPAAVLQVFGEVPDYEFVDQDNRKVSLKDFRGNIWVADFIFTRCAGPCPMMTSRMGELQRALLKDGSVKLVSFSVDPEHDQPGVLKEYSKSVSARMGQWFFLTGDKSQLYKMMSETFKLGVGEQKENPPGTAILHDTHFVLVDEEGRIRGYYGAADEQMPGTDPIPRILADIQSLSLERPQ